MYALSLLSPLSSPPLLPLLPLCSPLTVPLYPLSYESITAPPTSSYTISINAITNTASGSEYAVFNLSCTNAYRFTVAPTELWGLYYTQTISDATGHALDGSTAYTNCPNGCQ